MFAVWLGVAHCVGVGNGTDALQIALRAAGVGPGDDVVMPSLTFYATAEAAANLGARPVFCDVERETGLIDPARLEELVGARTAAVVAVHLYGQACQMDRIRAAACGT